MNEKQTPTASSIRPTKKQRVLLNFIETFIGEHGYSPSYREIMAGQGYNSVATVALHVNSLIKRGHLRKRDFNARSLEVISDSEKATITSNRIEPGQEKWLVDNIEHKFSQSESAQTITIAELDNLTTLVDALRVLGLDGAAQSFVTRLSDLRQKLAAEPLET